jgi:two-component system, LuxR family, response regulator FixJ
MKKHGQSAGGLHVVVVDDDVAVLRSLKFSLEIEGFAVRVYAGGIELLSDKALPGEVCLVVDQKMPQMSGLELIAQLRERGSAAPAILITSYPTVAVRERAAKAGVSIVEKPFLETILIERIRELLSQDGAAQAS